MAKYQVETDQGTFEVETDDSFMDKAKGALSGAMKMAGPAISNTPMGQISGMADTIQTTADKGGEMVAENLASKGVQMAPMSGAKPLPVSPEMAGAAGTAVQMAPAIVQSAMPGSPKLQTEDVAAPFESSNIATDARARAFGVKPSTVDMPGELESMRGSVKTLQGQGIEPKVFETAETMRNRVKIGIGEYGQMVRDIPKKLDQYGIKPRLNEEMLPTYLEAELSPKFSEGAYSQDANIVSEIANTAKGHSGSFQDLLELKQKLGEQAKFYRFNTGDATAPTKAKMFQQAYIKVNEILKNEINQVAPQLGPAWEQANQIYSAGMDVLPSATKATAKSAMSDITGMDLQHPLQSAKRPVNAAIAYGADKISRLMQSAPQALGKFSQTLQQAAAQGPKAFAVAHYTLSQKSPEYRTMLEESDNDQ